MKTLYLECSMGAAGDMLMSALVELIPDPDSFLKTMNGLGLPGVHVEKTLVTRCGITGTRICVRVHGEEEQSLDAHDGERAHDHGHARDPHVAHTHDHDHSHGHDDVHDHVHSHGHGEAHSHAHGHHRSADDVGRIIGGLPVSERVRANAKAVYGLIAQAESHAHGKPVTQVHFHEVGAVDAIADIVGVSLLIEELAPERVVVSPVHVGSGHIRCAHGILPVPAPATAYILRGAPTYGGSVRAELCTPTGAALIRHFADAFGAMPVMTVQKIGYGMGKKDFETMNGVRAFWGEEGAAGGPNGEIVELHCNMDDMTGEAAGFVCELLLNQGALDVFMVPVQMKKSRPGLVLACLCETGNADRFAGLMLAHTTTLGVRRTASRRYTLDRAFSTVETPYGTIGIKTGSGYGITKSKPEYEDVARAARAHDVPISAVYEAIREAKD